MRALAKLNLSLLVLNKRADGFHDLRTVFQTISLADHIDIEFTPGRGRAVELESAIEIENNLIVRAADLVMDALNIRGLARFRLTKSIPMGAGLGGGSSDAAAVLLSLPTLAGVRADLALLTDLAGQLGSDVPFFLHGGTALGIGRGTELYPLPELPEHPALVVAPDIHVSTPEAYRALARGLTYEVPSSILNSLQTFAWRDEDSRGAGEWVCQNDFETAVFRQHPRLSTIRRKLVKLGARPALMTGSGSAVFGIFDSPEARNQAASAFTRERAFPVKLISRRSYRALWRGQLRHHIAENKWPLRSWYEK